MKLKGISTVSILGDSISTYEGVSNDENANPTLKFNKVYYKSPFPLEKTYWKIAIDYFELTLLVNNSYSGGNLSNERDETSGVRRAKNLHTTDGIFPELVIIFMGTNDLGRNVSRDVFEADYRKTLRIIRENNPGVKVCCINLPDKNIFLKERTAEFNQAIDRAVKEQGEGVIIADLYNSRLNNDFYYNNTIDGLHPDEDGMRIIAEILTEALKDNFPTV